MTAFIEIILLIFIASFLVMQQKGGMAALLNKRRKIILDSCALIDGRIVEIVKTGFVVDELVIPQFILSELQLLADGNDSHKRERARFGLDIAHELQDASFHAKVTIDHTVFEIIPTTDDKLIQLAKKTEAYLYTTDFNLSKVASVEGVGVLNVNELAQGLRPVALPGETLKIKIIQKGSSPSQGVGYLEDGTMIVVEGGARHAGKAAVDVTVTRMHQTVAGKMVFGQVKEAPRRETSQQNAHSRHAQQAKVVVEQAQSRNSLHERLSRSVPQKAQPAAVESSHASPRRSRLGTASTAQAAKRTKPAPHRSSTRAASFQKIM